MGIPARMSLAFELVQVGDKREREGVRVKKTKLNQHDYDVLEPDCSFRVLR